MKVKEFVDCVHGVCGRVCGWKWDSL